MFSQYIGIIIITTHRQSTWKSKFSIKYIYIYIYIRGLSHKSWQLYFSSRTGENTENLRYAFEKVCYVGRTCVWYHRMVYVNNSVGLTMDQSSVCEWERHKMEVNKQEQQSYIKIAVLSPRDYDQIPKVKKPLRGKRFANKQHFRDRCHTLAIYMQRMVISACPTAGNEQWKPWVIILKVLNKWRLVPFM